MVKTRERTFFLLIGITVEEIFANTFDYAIYPFVIWKLGLVKGGAVMAMLSLAVCLVILAIYNATKKDWFGIELAKELREYKGNRRFLKMASWVLKKGQFASFLFFSLKFDPFTTVVYMRRGANQFPGMDRKSWAIFFASWMVANLSWAVVVFTGVSAGEYIWKALFAGQARF